MTGLRSFFWVLLVSAAVQAYAQPSYDRYAHLKPLPLSPSLPRDMAECQRYQESGSRVVLEVELAHDACIQTPGNRPSIRARPEDPGNTCSNPACQALHDARGRLQKTLDERVAACRSQVSDHHKKTQAEEVARRERRMREAQSDPCVREWLQYEAVCTGELESRQQQRQCQTELSRLRRNCPYSGR